MANGFYKKWLEPDNLVLLQGWKRNGLTDEQIAQNIGIRRETLYTWKKRFPNINNALKRGREQSNYIIESKLFQTALSGNTTAMIFWLKNNWRDKYNDSELSPEERKLAVARMKKLEAETRISKARAKALEDNGQDIATALDKIMDKLIDESNKESGNKG